ncbi:MAG: hypothetical protein Kow0079_02980 [Vicingaceae bacterium]
MIVSIFIAVIALKILYSKTLQLSDINISLDCNTFNLTAIIVLIFCNWFLESLKWKVLTQNITNYNIFQAFIRISVGFVVGLITPMRLGELIGRSFTEAKNRNDLLIASLVSSGFQFLTTILFGIGGLIIFAAYFNISFLQFYWWHYVIFLLIISVMFFGYKYFNKSNKIKVKKVLSFYTYDILIQVYLLSILRYIIFIFQGYLIFNSFNLNIDFVMVFMIFSIYFLINSFLPTVGITEPIVRGGVVLVVFSTYVNNSILIAYATIILWILNMSLPFIFGLFSLNKFKLLPVKQC